MPARIPILHEINTLYERLKSEARQQGIAHQLTVPIMERRHQLRPGSLTQWRYNQLVRRGRNGRP